MGKKKKILLISLSILLLLTIIGGGYWYFFIYRCQLPQEYRFLEPFITKNECKNKKVEMTGIMYNVRTDDEDNVVFDFNAWDLDNKENYYFEDISISTQKLLTNAKLDFFAQPMKASFSYNTDDYLWHFEELSLDTALVEDKLKKLGEYLEIFSKTEETSSLNSTYEISYMNFLRTLLTPTFTSSIEESEEPLNIDSSDEIISLEEIAYRCSIKKEMLELRTTNIISPSQVCTELTIEQKALDRINSQNSLPYSWNDYFQLVNTHNLSVISEDSLLNDIDLARDLFIFNNDSLQEDYLIWVINQVIYEGFFTLERHCSLLDIAMESNNEALEKNFLDNMSLFVNNDNLTELLQKQDKQPSESIYCVTNLTDSSNANYSDWANAYIYKLFNLYFSDDFVTKDFRNTHQLVNFLYYEYYENN